MPTEPTQNAQLRQPADTSTGTPACSVSVAPESPVTLATRTPLETLKATPNPPDATASNYKFEIKPKTGTTWTILSDSPDADIRYRPRVAGNFDVRVIAKDKDNNVLTSAVVPLEVQFPTGKQIAADPEVKQYMQEAWTKTLSLLNPKTRQEYGFWIELDTCDETYQEKGEKPGPEVQNSDPNAVGGVELDPRASTVPATPTPTDCALYIVAGFHTHTSKQYVGHPNDGDVWPVGPSRADLQGNAAQAAHLPGLLYDYAPSPDVPRVGPCKQNGCIPDGWLAAHDPQLFVYGYERRPTP